MPAKRKRGQSPVLSQKEQRKFSAELKKVPLVVLNIIRDYVYVYFARLLEDFGQKIDQCLKELPFLAVEESCGNYLKCVARSSDDTLYSTTSALHHMWIALHPLKSYVWITTSNPDPGTKKMLVLLLAEGDFWRKCNANKNYSGIGRVSNLCS